jgi:hypothetical protein
MKVAYTFLFGSLCMGASLVQAQVPRSIDEERRLIESVDRISVPIIEMEQLYVPPTGQRYRIEIFETGRANYQGLVAVKTPGEVEFEVSPEKAKRIIEGFERHGFWEMKEKQYGMQGFGHLNLRFTIRWKGRTKTVAFDNLSDNVQLLLKQLIEKEVNSTQWRCPFVDALKTGERCAPLKATAKND